MFYDPVLAFLHSSLLFSSLASFPSSQAPSGTAPQPLLHTRSAGAAAAPTWATRGPLLPWPVGEKTSFFQLS